MTIPDAARKTAKQMQEAHDGARRIEFHHCIVRKTPHTLIYEFPRTMEPEDKPNEWLCAGHLTAKQALKVVPIMIEQAAKAAAKKAADEAKRLGNANDPSLSEDN